MTRQNLSSLPQVELPAARMTLSSILVIHPFHQDWDHSGTLVSCFIQPVVSMIMWMLRFLFIMRRGIFSYCVHFVSVSWYLVLSDSIAPGNRAEIMYVGSTMAVCLVCLCIIVYTYMHACAHVLDMHVWVCLCYEYIYYIWCGCSSIITYILKCVYMYLN